jgi:hypothetical protein
LLLLVVLVCAVAACAPASTAPPSTVSLQDLAGVDQLQTLFAQDTGKPRLILLVSPT